MERQKVKERGGERDGNRRGGGGLNQNEPDL